MPISHLHREYHCTSRCWFYHLVLRRLIGANVATEACSLAPGCSVAASGTLGMSQLECCTLASFRRAG